MKIFDAWTCFVQKNNGVKVQMKENKPGVLLPINNCLLRYPWGLWLAEEIII